MANASSTPWSRRIWLGLTIALVAAACLVVGIPWLQSRAQSITTAVAEGTILPGDRVRVPVFVRDSKTGKPVAGAEVLAWTKLDPSGKSFGSRFDVRDPTPKDRVILGQVRTDARGVGTLEVTAPMQGSTNIMADVNLGLDQDRLDLLTVTPPEIWLMVTTDRPSYRSGDKVRMRILSLDEARRPINRANVSIELKGPDTALSLNAVTSEFGTATGEVLLPAGAPKGRYSMVANGSYDVGAFLVDDRALPRVRVNIQTAPARFEQPLRTLVTVRQASGRPLVGARLRIYAADYFVSPVTQSTPGPTTEGVTDDQGAFSFSIDWERWRKWGPSYHVAVFVADERTDEVIRLPTRGAAIEAVSEQAKLVPQVENSVFLRVSDGEDGPFQGDVDVVGGTLQKGGLDPRGYGVLAASPGLMDRSWSATLRVTDFSEKVRSKNIEFGVDGTESTLIRPSRSIYHVGERLELTLLSPTPGMVWVALMRSNRVLDGAPALIKDGIAKLEFPVTDKLLGPVTIHAIRNRISSDQERPQPGWPLSRRWVQAENVRRVFVDAGQDPVLRLQSDRPFYTPGDVAKLRVRVERAGGASTAASVFLASVEATDRPRFALLPGDDRARLADSSRFCELEVRRWSPEILLEPNEPGGDLRTAFALAGGRGEQHVLGGTSPWERSRLHLATLRKRLGLVGVAFSGWTLLLATMAITYAVKRRPRRGGGILGIVLSVAVVGVAWWSQDPLLSAIRQEETRAPGRLVGYAPGPKDEPSARPSACTAVRDPGYFPVPAVWLPELVVDATGTKVVELPIPEAIGPHELVASAVTADGHLATARMTLEIR